jgi:hypothetical protein
LYPGGGGNSNCGPGWRPTKNIPSVYSCTSIAALENRIFFGHQLSDVNSSRAQQVVPNAGSKSGLFSLKFIASTGLTQRFRFSNRSNERRELTGFQR